MSEEDDRAAVYWLI